MSLSSSKYTSLRAAVQAEPVDSARTLGVTLAAFAVEVELRTRRSVRRRFTNHQRIVEDARVLAAQAQFAAWLLQYQATEIAALREKVARLEEDAALHEWNEQARILQQFEQFEQLEDGRVFMETCAAEHSFRDLFAKRDFFTE